ncbi:MAG: Uma2 family endonuclease [Methylacidiphilaceae bacterium]|nr:Uma2 family endonuclease [Candidatus Methylacidiphilaceae bacterium]
MLAGEDRVRNQPLPSPIALRHRAGRRRIPFPGSHGCGPGGGGARSLLHPERSTSKVDGEANLQEGVIPALVVEILSPSTDKIDRVDKLEINRAAGIRECRIFD